MSVLTLDNRQQQLPGQAPGRNTPRALAESLLSEVDVGNLGNVSQGATTIPPAARSTLLSPLARLASHPGSGRGSPRRPLLDAWAELLEPYPWDWWVDGLTFRRWPEKGKERLDCLTPETVRGAWDDLRGWIRRRAGHWPEGVLVVDRGEEGDRLHLHALLTGCADVRRLSAMDYWQNLYGIARIEAYDSGQGARAYLSRKYLSSKVELDFTPGFDRITRTSGLLEHAARASVSLGCS